MTKYPRRLLVTHRVVSLALVALLLLPCSVAHAVPFLYATSRDLALVDAVAANGTFSLFSQGVTLNNIMGVTIDAVGNVYVGSSPNNINDKITKITPAGVQTVFAAFNENVSPTGLAFDASGNLFVAAQRNGSIRKITPGGTISTFASSGLLDRPFGLAFDGFGNLLVANLGNQKIVKVDPVGTQSLVASLSLNPYGLAFNTSGDLFVSYPDASKVDRISPAGVVSTFFSSPSLLNGGGFGLGLDPSENVYVATGGNKILRITSSGSSASLFSTMSNMDGLVQFIALSSPAIVPEPSTCASLLAGIACGGYSLLRRRRVR